MKNALLILSLLFAGQATAADISLTGPDGPIQPATYVILGVTGVPDPDLPKAVVQVSPADGTTILPAKTWGGSPIVIFSAAKPGKYTVTVHVGNSQSGNDSFRRPLEDGAKQAELARIDGALLSDLKGTVGRIAERYPLSGQIVIEVIGAQPPPPPPPGPQIDPPSTELQVMVSPITQVLTANKDKAIKLREAYLGLEEVARADAGQNLNSTAALMEWHRAALQKIPRGSDPPAVGILIDDTLAKALGISKSQAGYANVALSAADVTKLADTLHAIAWACAQAGR